MRKCSSHDVIQYVSFDYSSRNAAIGSILIARQAGPAIDATPVIATRTVTNANVTTSNGSTPKSIVVSTRLKPADTVSPMTTPITIMRAALPKTRRRMAPVVAPSAFRIPNSRRRCWTEYARMPNSPTMASKSARPANVATSTARNRWRAVAPRRHLRASLHLGHPQVVLCQL